MIHPARQDREEDLQLLRDALRAEAAEVGRALLGEPNVAASSKTELRWGGKGALSLQVTGTRRGLWFDHEGGEGGDLLGLVQHVQGCAFPAALDWARAFAKVGQAGTLAMPRQPAPERKAEQAAAEAAERARQHAEALGISRGGQAIEDTPGDWYLRQVRGIPRPVAGWPDCIRWHPGHRAVLAVATTADGTVQAVQRIHLATDGNKVSAEEVARRKLRAVKVTNGRRGGAVVRLPGDAAGPLLVAEGPETALAAWASTGHETWVALGGMGGVELPTGRRIVLCADDDPPGHIAGKGAGAKALAKATAAWRAAGLDFVVATPWTKRRHDKSDLADAILAGGPAAVRARIMAALGLDGSYVPPPRVPVEKARELVDAAVGAFFGRVDAGSIEMMAAGDDAPAPESFTSGLRVSTGAGKSHITRLGIARTLVAMRARGDMRKMAVLVPMHALSDEQAAAFEAIPEVREAGLKVAVWRGRGAPDPDHPDYQNPAVPRENKATMCTDLERVADVQAIGLNAQTAACARRIGPKGSSKVVQCPAFHRCAYQRQQAREADLWIGSHDLLFHERPAALGDLAAVVVDEAVWRKGLVGAEGQPVSLSLDTFGQDATIMERKAGAKDRISSARLEDLRGQLVRLFDGLPDGPLQLSALADTKLTAASCVEGFTLEYRRMVDPLHPGMDRDQRKAAMAQAEGNKTVKRMSMVWEALRIMLSPKAPAASGWIELARENTKSGPVRVVKLKARREVADGWKVPTLVLDALLPIDLVQPYWPDVQMVADVAVAVPHQHVRQVTDRAYSLAMLEPLDKERAKADPEENTRRQNRRQDLRAILIREAHRRAPGMVLVVLQQAVEGWLLASGPLPANLETAHHNNIAGVDRWKDAAAVIVVGRTLPPPSGVERIAEALTGAATPPLPGWYERGDATRELVDGSLVPAEAERHSNPLAEAIRWQTAEGELIQIVGRGRGVNRTAENPLEVLLLTDAPLPIPLASMLQDAALRPTPSDRMMAAGGLVLENPADVGAVYPELWGTNRDTIKSALRRGKLGALPYGESYIGQCTQLRHFSYKARGQGKSEAAGWYDPHLCPDLRAFLTAKLGELAWCRVEGDPKPPESPEPPKRGRKRAAEVEAGLGRPEPPAWEAAPDDAVGGVLAPSPWDELDEPKAPVLEARLAERQAGDHQDGQRKEAAVRDAEQASLAEQVGLEPGTVYRAGWSMTPHPGFPPFDALPVEGMWRIRRPAADLVVSRVVSPFRLISAGDTEVAPAVRGVVWTRVQGANGVEEPMLLRDRVQVLREARIMPVGPGMGQEQDAPTTGDG